MTNKLVEYSKEISPMIRNLLKQKELLKDFLDTDEKNLQFVEEKAEVTERQKAYLEQEEQSKDILDKIKEIENDIKQAVSGAAKGTNYKAAELKAFFVARAKEDAVDKTIDKGDLFTELKELLS